MIPSKYKYGWVGCVGETLEGIFRSVVGGGGGGSQPAAGGGVFPSKYKYGCCGVGGEWEEPWRESSGV